LRPKAKRYRIALAAVSNGRAGTKGASDCAYKPSALQPIACLGQTLNPRLIADDRAARIRRVSESANKANAVLQC
jgi:hypothetical protein